MVLPYNASATIYPEFLHNYRISGTMAKVLMALASFDQGSGVWVSLETVSKKLGLTKRAVQQNIRKLQDQGVLEVKQQFRGEHQQTNFYLFPIPAWWVNNQGDQGVNEISPNTGISSSPETKEETVHISGSSPSIKTPERLVPRETGVQGQFVVTQSSALEPVAVQSEAIPWKPLPRNSLLYTHRDCRQLVEHFQNQLTARDIRERGRARRISSKREWSWIQSANVLLDDHPLDEIVLPIDWLFDTCLGTLPFTVVNEHTGKVDPRERRITRLNQVVNHYTEIVETMWTQRGVHPLEILVDKDTMPKAFYDHGIGFPMEGQVATLVQIFTRSHPTGKVTDFDLFGWQKSFRIMLHHEEIPFADIKTVVTALAERRLTLDYGRYSAPYDLHRDGEWSHLMAAVELEKLREARDESLRAEDEVGRPSRIAFDTDFPYVDDGPIGTELGIDPKGRWEINDRSED